MNKRIISKEKYLSHLSRGEQTGGCFVYMGPGEWAFATQEVKTVAINKYNDRYYEPVTIFRTHFGIGKTAKEKTENVVVAYSPSLPFRGIPCNSIVVDSSFVKSPYNKVYENLRMLPDSSVYNTLISPYMCSETNRLSLNYSEDYAKMGDAAGKLFSTVTYGETNEYIAKTYYGKPRNIPQNEIGMAKTLLHEIIHAMNLIEGVKIPENHTGFDRELLLKGLKEYNEAYQLGISDDVLEIISWSGLEESEDFKFYINKIVKEKKERGEETDYEKEEKRIKGQINILSSEY